MLLAGEAAWANCSPQSQPGVIATCTGITLNQGEGPENTSASGNGYGHVSHSGITVTVDNNASVTGTAAGIVADGLTVTNNTGATIAGGIASGIEGLNGFANVTNSGTITSATMIGISASGGVTAINNTGAVINGAQYGIVSTGGNVDVTNSGSITGTSFHGIAAVGIVTVTNNAGASITGSQYGIWAVGGFASIFNAGTITGGTSAIYFQGGDTTLTLGPGSVISGDVTAAGGGNTFQLGGTGTATFDVSALDIQFSGFATFNKISNSVWTLTGTSIYGGPVNVNAGTLIVDGNISSVSAVTVNAGGTLAGNGIVGTTTVNAGGALAPGNSTALLTVQGSLTLAAASNYMVEVSPANASRTDVTGAADLGGATVRANFAAGSYVVRQYTIVNATGGLGGSTFGGVVNTNLSPNFRTTLSYDADNAYLNVLLSFIPPSGGLSGNQQNVGNALVNFFNRTGGIPLIFSELTPAGLTQISGETATGTQQTTFDAMTQFMGLLSDPSIDGRGSRNGAAAIPYADEAMAYAAKRRPNDALAAIHRQAPPPALAYAPSWSVWAAAFGGTQTTDGDAVLGSNTATSRIFGMAAGADYRMSPDTIVGFAMAGGGTHFNVANGGSGRTDLFQAGAFLRHQMGPAYVSAALAYGWQDVTTERTITIGLDRLQGRFDAHAFSARVESGYRIATAGMGVTPYAAAQFTTVMLPGYIETATSGTDTFALTYGAKDVTAPRTELGLRADKSFVVDGGILTLRGRAAWAHDYNIERSVGATFQTLPGASFVVNGAAPAREAALTTASAEMNFVSGWAVAATFEGEFSDVTRSYAGKGVVRYVW
ncbi:MAG: putative outer rane autotransporter barrel [Xanthobacteraceae bacterium]|nr:putative outer rane autotransporter barrel [Xanthobacteraceae bacterium]